MQELAAFSPATIWPTSGSKLMCGFPGRTCREVFRPQSQSVLSPGWRGELMSYTKYSAILGVLFLAAATASAQLSLSGGVSSDDGYFNYSYNDNAYADSASNYHYNSNE